MIYVTGDCHQDFSKFSMKSFPNQKSLTKDNLKKENEFLKDTLNIIRELIQPLKQKYPKIFNQISKIINQVLGGLEHNNGFEL